MAPSLRARAMEFQRSVRGGMAMDSRFELKVGTRAYDARVPRRSGVVGFSLRPFCEMKWSRRRHDRFAPICADLVDCRNPYCLGGSSSGQALNEGSDLREGCGPHAPSQEAVHFQVVASHP